MQKISPKKTIMCLVMCALCAICFCACDKSPYARDNSFEVEVIDGEASLIFEPKDFGYSYGVVFYVGTMLPPQNYAYLGKALARQGYLVVIPKFDGNMSYSDYKPKEDAFTQYPDVKFFICGHDQGGGAAIRRAQEDPSKIAGVALYAPICVERMVTDENGKYILDEDGNVMKIEDSIASLYLPTLLLETDDPLRTEEFKQKALSHVNKKTLSAFTLTNSTSNGFGKGGELNDIQKAQQTSTVYLTLAFLRNVVCK